MEGCRQHDDVVKPSLEKGAPGGERRGAGPVQAEAAELAAERVCRW